RRRPSICNSSKKTRPTGPRSASSIPTPAAGASSTTARTASALLAQLALLVGLPDLAARDVERRQPAVVVTAGIDALEMPQVADLAIGLQRVADDGRFARTMRAGRKIAQRPPKQDVAVLLLQRQIGQVIGVDEKMLALDVVQPAAFEKREVTRGNLVETRRRIVRAQGRQPAAGEPQPHVRLAAFRGQQHFFVIAQQRHEPAAAFQLDESL